MKPVFMMSTVELKASLHHMIEQEENESILSSVKQMLEQSRNVSIDELGGQTISEFNQEMSDTEREIDNGVFSTQEEVTTRFEQIFRR